MIGGLTCRRTAIGDQYVIESPGPQPLDGIPGKGKWGKPIVKLPDPGHGTTI